MLTLGVAPSLGMQSSTRRTGRCSAAAGGKTDGSSNWEPSADRRISLVVMNKQAEEALSDEGKGSPEEGL